MEKLKLKKDIQEGSFVIVNEVVTKFDKKIKISEMESDNEGIFVFESKEEGTKFLSSDKSDVNSVNDLRSDLLLITEFETESGINISNARRKLLTSGKYNLPIIVETKTSKVDGFNKFLRSLNSKSVSVAKEKIVFIEIFDKSKGTILNKLNKLKTRGGIDFVNNGSLISIV